MSSPLGQYLIQSHMDDLRREADRSRAAEAARTAGEDPFPKVIRSRRLGRLLRIVPARSRPAA
jgi:hypothetical protein